MRLKKPETLAQHLGPIWDEMANQVQSGIGAAGLEALCTQVHRMRDAHRRIGDEGVMVADAKGNPIPHPALTIERQAQDEIRKWLARWARH